MKHVRVMLATVKHFKKEREKVTSEQDMSLLQDIDSEEQNEVDITLDEECDISMQSMNETKEEASNNVSMKSLNCDDSMNGVNEVDLTDLSMKETMMNWMRKWLRN